MLSDVEIAHNATTQPIAEIAEKLGLSVDELEIYGRDKAKIRHESMRRFENRPAGKLILVTAITP
ncbi:MAG TPA: formate--tetrahydrofolate ligase, partial [Armatimonadota bacterium]